MPELPEVETTRRGLSPLVAGRRIAAVTIRQRQLRWPIPEEVDGIAGQTITALERRAKWLIWHLESGSLLWHLGMSGSFRGWQQPPAPGPHDHVDLQVENGYLIRFTDPRRFGALLWGGDQPLEHPRVANLGPEPLGDDFHGERLWRLSRGRKASVKLFIMDAKTVVGVGNIYASEALFDAGIHPRRPAGRISRARYGVLADTIRQTLADAIELGGTSLRDFTVGDGTPGYFGQSLKVYGREGLPCPGCGEPVRREIIGQRSTFFCPRCQR
ncbi:MULTISPECIES: bifunctional DNA-formamidopyrimidine glycosylase/DNA-(apurinic or apyrimidinic site) lyase [unclassified Wenzhouxiangella]|uniref:bifunctional DNA-formamidopyrimidine glycosylase/DNA-(apurinic or apyrimidinic site) lyase n=1 Tax=unclassified Wenzhouxiangella TaxID=2613841 RepID=UPI000E32556B|nr:MULTISPECIES: bifunctional DNA-formamidopyrimidine glycosylase/DNA-(apurinic or apyrimidinic site) lyase [unclassified Wenzhouxiangella]RFF26786.1 bifunctional DNA-formamidopyrimidine glycosylase/DNA-(apurinic or apyrimidinic site) lyase [Wenzhouxiangella sp. 15181]RFP67690.1 bifunctional DNA-formamidopyrimidine glycosylase/DNA-(apurinic or apyrimidinic site) lyase [Wenzhouxiangella sp. 15190]